MNETASKRQRPKKTMTKHRRLEDIDMLMDQAKHVNKENHDDDQWEREW